MTSDILCGISKIINENIDSIKTDITNIKTVSTQMYNKIDEHNNKNKDVKVRYDAIVGDLNNIAGEYNNLQKRIEILNEKKENDDKYSGMLNYSNLDLNSTKINYHIMLFLAICLSIGAFMVYRIKRKN